MTALTAAMQATVAAPSQPASRKARSCSWPSVFMITANCSEAAAYRLIGLPYEIWSGLLFAGLGALGLVVLNKR